MDQPVEFISLSSVIAEDYINQLTHWLIGLWLEKIWLLGLHSSEWVSEWVSSFLTAHQHNIRLYSAIHGGTCWKVCSISLVEDNVKRWKIIPWPSHQIWLTIETWQIRNMFLLQKMQQETVLYVQQVLHKIA